MENGRNESVAGVEEFLDNCVRIIGRYLTIEGEVTTLTAEIIEMYYKKEIKQKKWG